jgi:hypothetical protein
LAIKVCNKKKFAPNFSQICLAKFHTHPLFWSDFTVHFILANCSIFSPVQVDTGGGGTVVQQNPFNNQGPGHVIMMMAFRR